MIKDSVVYAALCTLPVIVLWSSLDYIYTLMFTPKLTGDLNGMQLLFGLFNIPVFFAVCFTIVIVLQVLKLTNKKYISLITILLGGVVSFALGRFLM